MSFSLYESGLKQSTGCNENRMTMDTIKSEVIRDKERLMYHLRDSRRNGNNPTHLCDVLAVGTAALDEIGQGLEEGADETCAHLLLSSGAFGRHPAGGVVTESRRKARRGASRGDGGCLGDEQIGMQTRAGLV